MELKSLMLVWDALFARIPAFPRYDIYLKTTTIASSFLRQFATCHKHFLDQTLLIYLYQQHDNHI